MDFQVFTDKAREKTRSASNKATLYFKAHWVDSVLFFFILLVLGAFDFFVLKQSDKFLSLEYWYHTFYRLIAYVLAGILGIRIFYPKAKAACFEFWKALSKNRYYLPLKELNSVAFSGFISDINNDTKISAWKAKITAKLTKLDKHSPDIFSTYYKTGKKDLFDKYSKFKKKYLIKRAEKYCLQRKIFEMWLTDEYINENLEIINVKYFKIYETDFTQTTGKTSSYTAYYTRPNVKGNAAKMIGNGLFVSILIAILTGSFVLTIDEALFVERVETIVSIIINAIFDIGFTVWKFVSAAMDCPRIVRQEDLRSVLDQNEILLRFKKTLPPENIVEYNNVLGELKQEELELAKEQA